MNITVIGLGKLGLPMAAYYASKGHKVIGCDTNEELVVSLHNGLYPFTETGLDVLLHKVYERGDITFWTKEGIPDAVASTDISFIIVPTPSDENGEFSNKYVIEAVKTVGKGLRKCDQYPIVVITSTVMPGTMVNVVKPLLEEVSGKKCGDGSCDFGLCYNPEFVALGSVIEDMRNPDNILIGEDSETAGFELANFQSLVTEHSIPYPIYRMSLYNAEVAKLMLNVYVTTKISLANTFASMCESIPTGDIDKVTDFLGADRRIGKRYLRGGLGYGGTCFPRDPKAYIAMANKVGAITDLQQATSLVNIQSYSRVSARIAKLANRGRVAILGVTYKPNTDVVEESAVLDIMGWLLQAGCKVTAHDPMGLKNMPSNLIHVDIADSVENCLLGADVAVLATPWVEYSLLLPYNFINQMNEPVLFDCWRFYDRDAFELAGVEYHAIGLSDDR